jgi:hypothetical protein
MEFRLIKMFCFLNVSYILQDIVNGIVTKRLGRFFEFPTLQHLADLILMVSSFWIYQWIAKEIDQGVNDNPDQSETVRL